MSVAAPSKVKKVKKAKTPKLSKEKKQSLIDGKLDDLMAARMAHGAAIIEWEAAHAHAGELKKTMERRQYEINSIVADIDSIRRGNYTPPLPFGEEPKAATNGKAPTGDGLWRKVEMSTVLNGSKDLLTKLDSAGIRYVGEFQDAMNERRKIAGLGPGKIGTVSDRLAEYWKKHPELLESPKVETKAEAPAEGNGQAPTVNGEMPPCPYCKTNALVNPHGQEEFFCDQCKGLFDAKPNEGVQRSGQVGGKKGTEKTTAETEIEQEGRKLTQGGTRHDFSAES